MPASATSSGIEKPAVVAAWNALIAQSSFAPRIPHGFIVIVIFI